jgi:putative DNA primase/helicase
MRFEDAIYAGGLRTQEVIADGRWHRCPTSDHPRKKNGAYRIEPDRRRGWFRDWANHDGLQSWADDSDYKPTPRDEERQRRQREKQRQDRIQGIGFARKLWADGKQYRVHKYLADKGLTPEGCHMLRIWTGGVWVDEGQRVDDTWLLVPIYWRDRLVNVQRISSNGIKRQMKNAPQKACSLVLGRPRAALTVIAEGLATGLACYQSIRHARVIVAFFADNLLPVVQEMKPTGSVVIAADNDWQTKARRGFNPGIEKANNAAELIGCGVAWPEGIEGTDFADYLKETGEGAARKVERLILARAKYVAGVA